MASALPAAAACGRNTPVEPASPPNFVRCGLYEGQTIGGLRCGLGRLNWPSGLVRYDGDWREGLRWGVGREFNESGRLLYVGGWIADMRGGCGNVCCDGLVVFSGRFVAGLSQGMGRTFCGGVLVSEDLWRLGVKVVDAADAARARVYVGEQRDGAFHGQGWLHQDISPSTGQDMIATMQGAWADNLAHGYGSMWANDDVHYVGHKRHGNMHGAGIHVGLNQTVLYTGSLAHGERSGFGMSFSQQETHDGLPIVAYAGRWSRNERRGAGTSWFLGNREYQGGWRADKYHGAGALFYADGSQRFAGAFRAGKRSGQGTFHLVTSGCDATYEGSWLDDVPAGAGTLTVRRGGAAAFGLWSAMAPTGEQQFKAAPSSAGVALRTPHGQFVLPPDRMRALRNKMSACDASLAAWMAEAPSGEEEWAYAGQWECGQRHGAGVLTRDGALVYDGLWAHNKMHGRGRLTDSPPCSSWKNTEAGKVSLYEGELVHNERSGQGVAHMSSGAVYTGAWLRDRPHGAGALHFGEAPGSANDCVAGGAGLYLGDFARGVASGQGSLSVSGQVWYTGKFSGGLFHGQGKLRMDAAALLAAGIRHTRVCQYVGGFRDGQRDGQGVLTDSHGLVLRSGKWANGVFVPPAAAPEPDVAALAADKLAAKAELSARRAARELDRQSTRRAVSTPNAAAAADVAVEPEVEVEAEAEAEAGRDVRSVLNRRARRGAAQADAAREAAQVARLLASRQTPAGAQREAVPMFAGATHDAAAAAAQSDAAGRRRAAKTAKRAKPARESLDGFNGRA